VAASRTLHPSHTLCIVPCLSWCFIHFRPLLRLAIAPSLFPLHNSKHDPPCLVAGSVRPITALPHFAQLSQSAPTDHPFNESEYCAVRIALVTSNSQATVCELCASTRPLLALALFSCLGRSHSRSNFSSRIAQWQRKTKHFGLVVGSSPR